MNDAVDIVERVMSGEVIELEGLIVGSPRGQVDWGDEDIEPLVFPEPVTVDAD